jgi:hypothetical protein
MVVLRPERVRFGNTEWDGVVRISIDRQSTRLIEEWGDEGAYAVFADVARIRVKMRIVQEFSAEDLDAPIPGDMEELRIYVSAGTDAGEKLVVADAVVESVSYSSSGSRSERVLHLICVSDDGIEDPVDLRKPV